MQRGVKGIGFFATIYYEVGGTVYCKSLGKNIQFREKELHGEAKKKAREERENK